MGSDTLHVHVCDHVVEFGFARYRIRLFCFKITKMKKSLWSNRWEFRYNSYLVLTNDLCRKYSENLIWGWTWPVHCTELRATLNRLLSIVFTMVGSSQLLLRKIGWVWALRGPQIERRKLGCRVNSPRQGRPFPAIHRTIPPLRCGPSFRTFAAGAISSGRRTGKMRTNRHFW